MPAKKKTSKKSKPDDAPHEDASFETCISELSQVVRDLEEGQLTLDESLERYEQGVRFVKRCQEKLRDAERRIEVLSGMDSDGNPTVDRFDDEELSLTDKADQRSRRRTAQPGKKSSSASTRSRKSGDVDETGALF